MSVSLRKDPAWQAVNAKLGRVIAALDKISPKKQRKGVICGKRPKTADQNAPRNAQDDITARITSLAPFTAEEEHIAFQHAVGQGLNELNLCDLSYTWTTVPGSITKVIGRCIKRKDHEGACLFCAGPYSAPKGRTRIVREGKDYFKADL